MARSCPSCGYGPLGVFDNNCPMCAEVLRGGEGGYSGSGAGSLPPALIAGWIGVGLVVAYLFGGDVLALLLHGAVLGCAWWLVARAETTRLLQIVGGSVLGLFVLGIVLAANTSVLPGLEGHAPPEEQLRDFIQNAMQGISPHTAKLCRRMKTVGVVAYVIAAAVVLPLALCVPPLLHWRRQRRLGGPMYLTRTQGMAGLFVLPLVLAGIVWLALPTMRSWTETPQRLFPDGFPPRHPMDPDDD